jgi:hypothetical protein
MLELNVNQNRSLNFEIQLSGVDPKQLQGFLRIIIDGIEHGFKAEISQESILVDIPPLRDVFKRDIQEGEKFDAKLEAYGSGYYFNPWNGSFLVKSPVIMEAKIREDVLEQPPKIIAKVKLPSNKAEDKLREMKKVASKVPTRKSGEDKKLFEKKMENTKPKVVVTEKHIIDYMIKKGTTSNQVQQLILEQCKSRTNEPLEVLKAVINFYRNKTK